MVQIGGNREIFLQFSLILFSLFLYLRSNSNPFMKKKLLSLAQLALAICLYGGAQAADGNFADTTRAYSMPLFAQLPQNNIGLSWTETDNDGVKHLFWATSTDQGKTFSDKKLIYSSKGISSSRLMRAKVLVKKNGTLVAVFGLAPQAPQAKVEDHSAHAGHGPAQGAAAEKPKGPRGGGRPADLQIVFMESKDNGNSWTSPETVHQDKTPKIIRGFFDSIVMANDEIAVAFLKDTGKPHDRDLRLVTSVNGKFGEERVIDSQSCDCCSISLLTDKAGKLNVFFRSNINNIRDISQLISSDNGKTFSKVSVVLSDKWEVNGCPHSGPVSVAGNGTNLISWFSAAPDAPGVRLSTQSGKRLFVLKPEASNPALVSGAKQTVMLWEETNSENSDRAVVLQGINEKQGKTGDAKKVARGTNPVGIGTASSILVASEVPGQGTKKTISLTPVKL